MSPQIPPRRTRRDRLSVSVIPEPSLDPIFQCPHLPLLFQDARDAEGFSDIKCDSCLADLDDADEMKTHDAVMREVTAWLELNDRDSEQGFRRARLKRSVSCAQEPAALCQRCPPPSTTDPQVPDSLVQFIALQLLASCYTILPGLSAECGPLYEHKSKVTIGTALRLHSLTRFSPAAGHHAREGSESSPWPGLYSGPSLEERLAEKVSETRRNRKFHAQLATLGLRTSDQSTDENGSSASGPQRTHGIARGSSDTALGTGWSDGPSENGDNPRSLPITVSLETPDQPRRGLLDMLLCPPLASGNAQAKGKRKRRKSKKTRKWSLSDLGCAPPIHIPYLHLDPSHKDPLKSKSSKSSPVKSIFSLWPRRTQSAPRRVSDPQSTPETKGIYRRQSHSTPVLSTRTFHGQKIPEIRRISATTIGDGSLSPSQDLSGGGPFAAIQDRSDGSPLSLTPWSTWSTHRRSIPNIPPLNSPSPGISPLSTLETLTSIKQKRQDYFGHVALATLHDEAEDDDDCSCDAHVKRRVSSPDIYAGDDDDDDEGGGSEDSSIMDKRKSRFFDAIDFAEPALNNGERRAERRAYAGYAYSSVPSPNSQGRMAGAWDEYDEEGKPRLLARRTY